MQCHATVAWRAVKNPARREDIRRALRKTPQAFALPEGLPAFFSGALAAWALPSYFFRNRSTRPAVSTSLYLPVKKGWQLAQISTWKEPRVERVSITLPQAQVIRAGT